MLWDSALFTAKEALAGFLLGAFVGFALAVVLVHSRLLQRGLMPYVVASQTIPILAIAPMVVVWVNPKLPHDLRDWGAVAVIAAYLTFFPVVINTLRGLQSADRHAHELMRSYAARGGRSSGSCGCRPRCRYLFAALKVAATASVVGAIIGELPASIQDGLGGAILNFNQYYTARAGQPLGDEPGRGGARHLLLPRGGAGSEARRETRAGAHRMSASTDASSRSRA